MFTGIIQELGRVESIERQGDSARIVVEARDVVRDVAHGASIAVNGVCLTVTEFDDASFAVDVMAQTLDVTSLSSLAMGSPVNLERAMRADGRFDGHIVQGHVDGVGEIVDVRADEHWTKIAVQLPAGLTRYVVSKGSITLDGVSLTVAELVGDRATVSLIPTTLTLTNLSTKQVGDRLNIEVDVLAKYTERLLVVEEVRA